MLTTCLQSFAVRSKGDLLRSCVGNAHNQLFESRDYGDGKKSPPEWSLTLSKKKLELLDQECSFAAVVGSLERGQAAFVPDCLKTAIARSKPLPSFLWVPLPTLPACSAAPATL